MSRQTGQPAEQIPLFKKERRLSPSTRSILLGGPGGYLTVVPAETAWTIPYSGQYRDWVRLMSIRGCLTPLLAAQAKLWAVRTFGRSA